MTCEGKRGTSNVHQSAATLCQTYSTIAQPGGRMAARVAGAPWFVAAATGADGGGRLSHFHFTSRKRARAHPSGQLSGLGPRAGSRAARVRAGTHVVLRPGDLQYCVRGRFAV